MERAWLLLLSIRDYKQAMSNESVIQIAKTISSASKLSLQYSRVWSLEREAHKKRVVQKY